MPDEQNPERSNAEESDQPEPGREEPAPNASSQEPSHAHAGESWLASDRVQALANVLTVIVALTAIGLSIWQGYENRMSNRLSVIPNLDSVPATIGLVGSVDSDYFPLITSLNVDSTGAVSYSLQNSGLGPAVIQNFLVFTNGEKIYDAASEREENRNWNSELRAELGTLPFDTDLFRTPYGPGDMLGAGEVHSFLSVAIPSPAFADTNSFDGWPPGIVRDSVLEKYSFVFCYCSVYEEDCGAARLGAVPPKRDVCHF